MIRQPMTTIPFHSGWRLAGRRIVSALGLAAIPLLAGCTALGVAAYKFGGNPIVPAHYKPKSEPMVVVVQREENPSDARLDADRIGRFVTDDLAKNKVGPMIDPSDVPVTMSHAYGSVWAAARLSATGPSTQPRSVLEMGRAAGARQVLYVDLTEFIVQQAIASEMVHGQAKATVRILDADTGEIRWPQDSTQGYLIQVTTPYSDGSSSATEQEMRDQMCRDLSERISHLFYEWNSDQMDSGSPWIPENSADNPRMLFCLGTTPTVQRSMFFDRLALDAVNRAAEVREYASGKSINVARVAHQLGVPVIATGFAGSVRGDFFLGELDRDGVRHDFVSVAAPLRTCTTVVDRATSTATELVEESSPIEPRKWEELAHKIEALGAGSKWWVLSGSLPPQAPQDFYATCLELAQKRGATVLLDTRGEPLRQALKWPRFIAKLNREELAATVGHALDDESALRTAMEQARPKDGTIVVTLGSQGAIVSDGHESWRVTPPRVKAISAVGSGDAFSAGMAVGLLRGKSLSEALVLAAACGTANAMTSWAGYVLIEDVRELEPRVKVEAI